MKFHVPNTHQLSDADRMVRQFRQLKETLKPFVKDSPYLGLDIIFYRDDLNLQGEGILLQVSLGDPDTTSTHFCFLSNGAVSKSSTKKDKIISSWKKGVRAIRDLLHKRFKKAARMAAAAVGCMREVRLVKH